MKMLKKIIFLFMSLFIVNEKLSAQEINFFGAIQAGQTTIEQSDLNYGYIENKATINNLSSLGFKFSQSFDDQYQGMLQFVQSSSSNGLQMDLLQVSKTYSNGLRLRVGKQRVPNWLVSEHIQVSALIPWMVAPLELYERMPVTSFTGMSFEKTFGYFSVILYAGDAQAEFDHQALLYNIKAGDIFGTRLSYGGSNYDLFISHMESNPELQIEKDQTVATSVFGKLKKSFTIDDYKITNAGLRYNFSSYLIMSEYSFTQSNAAVYEKFESGYLSFGKYLSHDLLLLATYAADLDVKSTLAPSETASYVLDLNYKLNLSNVLKFSFRHVNFREKSATSPFGTSVNGLLTMASSPKENFDVYMAEWSFVF
jgi:hypothetical protein